MNTDVICVLRYHVIITKCLLKKLCIASKRIAIIKRCRINDAEVNLLKNHNMFAIELFLLFTVSGPQPSASRSGAVLLKCKGTVVNLDPVLYSWLSYQPRVSSSSLAQTISKSKQLRRTPSQPRLMSAVTPRKKSYARGNYWNWQQKITC